MSGVYTHRTSQSVLTLLRWGVLALGVFLFGLGIYLFSRGDLVEIYVVGVLLALSVFMGFAFSRKQLWSSTVLFCADTAGLYFPPPTNPWDSRRGDEITRSGWLHIPWSDVARIYSVIESDRDGAEVESIVFAFDADEDAVKQFWVEDYSEYKLCSSLGLSQDFLVNGLWHAKYANGVFEHGVTGLVQHLQTLQRPQEQ